MSFQETASYVGSAVMTVCTLVYRCLHRAVACALTATDPLQLQTTADDQRSRSRCANATREPMTDCAEGSRPFMEGHRSWDADDFDFTTVQTYHRYRDILDLMDERYCTKCEHTKMDFKQSKTIEEQKAIRNINEVLEKQIERLEKKSHREQLNLEDFQTAIRDSFRRREDLNNKRLNNLQETDVLMQQRIQTLEVSTATSELYVQKLSEKLENLGKKMAALPPIDSQVTTERLHEHFVNMQETVDMLVTNIQSLTHTLLEKSREIAVLKTELAVVKRNSRNKAVQKSDFDSIRTYIKKFEMHVKNDFERLDMRLADERARSHDVEVENTNKLLHKYELLHMRLIMVEKIMENCSFFRTNSKMYTDEYKNNQAAKAFPVPLVNPAPLTTTFASLETPEPPVNLVVPKTPAPLPLPMMTISPPSSYNASRKPDEECKTVLTMEMFQKQKLKKTGGEPKKVFKLPPSVPKT